MDESAFAQARGFLGDESLEFAEFGTLRWKSSTALQEDGTGNVIMDEGSPPRPKWEAPNILAVGAESVYLIDRDEKSVSVVRQPVFDVCAELDTSGEFPVVRLEPSDIIRQHLDVDSSDIGFSGAEFVLSTNGPLGSSVLAQHLAEVINRAGDPGMSSHGLLRFLARSIRAHQANEPVYLNEILRTEYRSFVRKTSVGGAIRDMAEKDPEWFPSFRAAFDAAVPDEDEIFLLNTDHWIVTNRRLYLVDARNAPESVRLDTIRRYRFHGLLRRSLEIQLASGTVLRRPGPEQNYLSEGEFERLMGILATHGAIGDLARGHA